MRELATGAFLDAKRNIILIGGTGTGKTHLAIGIASAVIRARARGRFFNLVDLVNQLGQEKAAGRSGRVAETLERLVSQRVAAKRDGRSAAVSRCRTDQSCTARPRALQLQPPRQRETRAPRPRRWRPSTSHYSALKNPTPEIVESILEGRHDPERITLERLMRPFPAVWSEQRQSF